MKYLFSLLILLTTVQMNGQNLAKRSSYFPGSKLSAIWGYTDPAGREYALLGMVGTESKPAMLQVVEVTDPTKPRPIQTINGNFTSQWREMKVYGNYAYVVTEATQGMLIVDLSTLPDSVSSKGFFTDQGRFTTAHTVWIDEDGLLYLWGSNVVPGKNGYAVYDLKVNPVNPPRVFTYTTPYIHDGLVIGNRMYLSHVYDGYFSIYDVSNKFAPVYLGAQFTPSNFTHNTWPSDDGKVLFTTDEKPNSYLAAYDISDPSNIKELDRIQTNPGGNAIVHNTHVLGNFAISSYYTEGITIHDISDPENMVEVGKFDCSAFAGGTFNGVWEVYPYFPSGNIIAGDMEGGLFVFTPVYVKGCYLHGTVVDKVTGDPLNDVVVELPGLGQTTRTKPDGTYKLGYHIPGKVSVIIRKPGYQPEIINEIELKRGEIATTGIQLKPNGTGIGEFAKAGFKVLSNPISESIMVIGEGKMESAQILDLNGRVLKNLAITNNEINEAIDLSTGIYLLQLNANGARLIEKVVVQ